MKKLMFLVAAVLLFAACEKIIDYKVKNEPSKIVINGLLSPDSIPKVNITESIDILEEEKAIYIENATVKLYENERFIEELQYLSHGNYIGSGAYIKAGETYRIEVTAAGLEKATAETEIPFPPDISRIDTFTFSPEYYQNILLHCSLTLNEPAETKNYYAVKGFIKHYFTEYDEYGDERPGSYVDDAYLYSDDPLFNDFWYADGLYFADNLINGKNKKLHFEIDAYAYNDSAVVYVTFCSVNKDYYLYSESYTAHQEFYEDPLSEAVTVYNNINGGYGIWCAQAAKVDSFTIINPYIK